MHKDDCPIFRQNDIGTARKIFHMQPESISHPMEKGTNCNLWHGVLATNAGHVPAAALGR